MLNIYLKNCVFSVQPLFGAFILLTVDNKSNVLEINRRNQQKVELKAKFENIDYLQTLKIEAFEVLPGEKNNRIGFHLLPLNSLLSIIDKETCFKTIKLSKDGCNSVILDLKLKFNKSFKSTISTESGNKSSRIYKTLPQSDKIIAESMNFKKVPKMAVYSLENISQIESMIHKNKDSYIDKLSLVQNEPDSASISEIYKNSRTSLSIIKDGSTKTHYNLQECQQGHLTRKH